MSRLQSLILGNPNLAAKFMTGMSAATGSEQATSRPSSSSIPPPRR